MKLNVQGLDLERVGLAAGILWGLITLVATHPSYSGYAAAFLNSIPSIYPGYSISLAICLIGLVCGFYMFKRASEYLRKTQVQAFGVEGLDLDLRQTGFQDFKYHIYGSMLLLKKMVLDPRHHY